MWQSPNQRVRAIAIARKRERDRLLHPIHFRRVEATLTVTATGAETPQSFPVRVILNDLSPKGMGLFVTQALVAEQDVTIQLKDPREITVSGRVVACQEYHNEGHILTPKSYPYRMGIRFLFKTAEEEKAFQDFCNELSVNHLYGQKAA